MTAGQRVTVLDAIERQLTHEPLIETRNRKPLRPNPIAAWELRAWALRVFYAFAAEAVSLLRDIAASATRDYTVVT